MNEEIKRRAIEMIDQEFREFEAFFRSLSAADLDRPVFGEGEDWRVRDVPAHAALWQWVATQVAEKVRERGQVPDTPDWDIWAGIETPTDELNEQNYRKWRGRSLDDSLEHLATQHRELMRALQELTPAQITTGPTLPDDLQPFLRAPGVRHLRMHRKHIDAAVGATTEG